MSELSKIYGAKGAVLRFSHLATGTTVYFPAVISDFSESYSSNWNTTTGAGRVDAVEQFQNTGRAISLTWDIPSEDEVEARQNLYSIQRLAAMLYATYEEGSESASSVVAKPLVKLRFGNLLQEVGGKDLLGRLDGVKYTYDVEEGFFSTAPGVFYPKTIKASCGFTVYHSVEPSRILAVTAKTPTTVGPASGSPTGVNSNRNTIEAAQNASKLYDLLKGE